MPTQFAIEQVQLQFVENKDILCLCVAQNKLCFAVATSCFIIDLNTPSKVHQIKVASEPSELHFNGRDLLIQTPKGWFQSTYSEKELVQAFSVKIPAVNGLQITQEVAVFVNGNGVYEYNLAHHKTTKLSGLAGETIGVFGNSVMVSSGGVLRYWDNRKLHGTPQSKTFDVTKGSKLAMRDGYFMWITEKGCVVGEDVLNAKMLNIKAAGCILSKYHYVVFNHEGVIAINKFDDKVVYHEKISGVLNLSTDGETLWLCTDRHIYEIVVTSEEANALSFFMSTKEFDKAMEIAHEDMLPFIHGKKAESLIELDPLAAAKCFVKSSVPFESVALKLFSNKNALLCYLNGILPSCDSLQKKVVTSWCVSLYIDLLNDGETCETEFQKFIGQWKSDLDYPTIYDTIYQSNRRKELLFVANSINDYDYVASYWIKLENWYEALKVMEKKNDPELCYQYATILLCNCPAATVQSWMRLELDVAKLLPSMLTYTELQSHADNENHALKYISWYITTFSCTSPIVYNTFLYILILTAHDEQNIIKWLDNAYYDSDFILRLSLKHKKYQVAVHIYSLLEMFDESVDLALEHNLFELAKLVADRCSEDKKHHDRLWIKIAKKSEKPLELVHEVPIKDLLPLLSLNTIDSCKNELMSSLEKHGSVMAKISQDIKDSIKISKELKLDIKTYEARFRELQPGESCSLCGLMLQTRKFYVFPCGHNFHGDCMSKVPGVGSDLGSKCVLCSDLKVNTIDEPFVTWKNDKEAQEWVI